MELEERQAMKPSDKDHPNEASIETTKPNKFKKWNYFSEYCGSTTIHGVSYLGEPHRPILERIWWIIVFIISISTLVVLIRKTWVKWDDSPVIVSFNDKFTPLWQIPFPAITICPQSKFRQTGFNLSAILQATELTEKEVETLVALTQICDREMVKSIVNQPVIKDGVVDGGIISLLEEISNPLDEVIFECSLLHQDYNCSDLFSKIITEEGICFTMNGQSQQDLMRDIVLQKDYLYIHGGNSSEDWSLEDGYTENSHIDSYPQRAIGAGANFQVQVYLRQIRKDQDSLCSVGNQGYKVLLHQPAEYPRIAQQFFHLPLDQEVIASVKPNMMTISDGLRSYDPHRRQCYYPNERKLRFYKTYTQNNCEQECLANITQASCGCVSFSMPRDSSTPICGPAEQDCRWGMEFFILLQNCPPQLLKNWPEYSKFEGGFETPNCDCLPACKSIQYNADLSQSSFDLKQIGALDQNFDPRKIATSRLTIHFHESHILTTHRSELTGYTDFLANIGGLLGLFMGVSILSFIEILYFLSLRLFYTLRAHVRGDNKNE